jgi:hypothetical protein
MGYSSAELADEIFCCTRISKAPPNNNAIAIAPELAALGCNAAPSVKFVYRVEPSYETAKRYDHIYKVRKITSNGIRTLSVFVAGHCGKLAQVLIRKNACGAELQVHRFPS